jgi:hypothetical protein
MERESNKKIVKRGKKILGKKMKKEGNILDRMEAVEDLKMYYKSIYDKIKKNGDKRKKGKELPELYVGGLGKSKFGNTMASTKLGGSKMSRSDRGNRRSMENRTLRKRDLMSPLVSEGDFLSHRDHRLDTTL